MSLADHVVVLRDGAIEDQGPPERLYLRPATRFAATFMGDSNLIDGTVVGTSEGRVDVETAVGRLVVEGTAGAGDAVTLAIRPEHLRIDAQGEVALGEGRVAGRHFVGIHQRCRVIVGEREFILTVPTKPVLEEGSVVSVTAHADDFVVLT